MGKTLPMVDIDERGRMTVPKWIGFRGARAAIILARAFIGGAPGDSGGHVKDPTYEQVTMGATGHAEVVQVRFDPKLISYREVLEIFFTMNDPTPLDRHGA